MWLCPFTILFQGWHARGSKNDGSESAADERGAKKKRRGVLYIISASAVEGRLLVHAGLATETEIISMGG